MSRLDDMKLEVQAMKKAISTDGIDHPILFKIKIKSLGDKNIYIKKLSEESQAELMLNFHAPGFPTTLGGVYHFDDHEDLYNAYLIVQVVVGYKELAKLLNKWKYKKVKQYSVSCIMKAIYYINPLFSEYFKTLRFKDGNTTEV